MKTASPTTVRLSDARRVFDAAVASPEQFDTRVVIESGGVPVLGIVTAEDVERLNRLDSQDAEFDRALAAMRAAFADVPQEELEREIEKALAEVDAERAAKRAAGEYV